MRIGIDAHSAERDGTGNCTYIRNLLLQLSEIDEENQYVLFVTDPHHPFYERIANRRNIEIVPVRRSPAWLRVFWSLAVATYRTKIDLLHVQYFAPFGHRGRLINTVHDLTSFRYPEYFSRFERLMFKFLLPPSARRATSILTASAVSKEDLIHLMQLSGEKIKVTHCGVSENFSSEDGTDKALDHVRERYKLQGKFLLYAGRIDPRKNLTRLVQAYAHLRRTYSLDLELAIAGGTYLEPDSLQETLKRCEYQKDIQFCGYVPDQDLAALYRAAEVFVYTSEYEGFGLPPLEAMASGTPVVASDISIFREILGDAAVLVDPRNIQDIAEGIYRILGDDALRKNLVEKGKNRAKEFTWQSTAVLTLQAYREAMTQRS